MMGCHPARTHWMFCQNQWDTSDVGNYEAVMLVRRVKGSTARCGAVNVM